MIPAASDFRRLASGALVIALSVTARAQDPSLQSLEDLRHIAERFAAAQAPAQKQLHVTAGALDPRLRLAACTAKPVASLAPGATLGARSTVGLRCTQPAWSVYVPVNIESEIPVLVLKRAATRGAALTEADVETQTRRVPGFASRYVGDLAALQGRHLKMSASPGTPLNIDLLAADIVVKRGQRVTLLAAVGGIEVRAQGQAMADSRADGRVRVQNLSSMKVVEGFAENADLVRVSP